MYAYAYKLTSLPRLVTPANVPDMAAQLQGMFGIPEETYMGRTAMAR